jgi:hypothetical protein
VKWLLDHGADPNARWSHWDAEVTPLHLAAWQADGEVVRLLLDAGADPTIRDSKHTMAMRSAGRNSRASGDCKNPQGALTWASQLRVILKEPRAASGDRRIARARQFTALDG